MAKKKIVTPIQEDAPGRLHVALGVSYGFDLQRLEQVAEYLVKSQQVPKDVGAKDAVCCYLMERHHWLPGQIRTLPVQDLVLAVAHVQIPEPAVQKRIPVERL